MLSSEIITSNEIANNIISTEQMLNNISLFDNICNKFTSNELEKLRKEIELLEIRHHIEIAKLLKNNNIKLMENNNGIFINLNKLPSKLLNEIIQYMNFVKEQESLINIDKFKKKSIKNKYFKDNKDILSYRLKE